MDLRSFVFVPRCTPERSTLTSRSSTSSRSEAAMEHARQRGAAHIDRGPSEDDVAARALYESAGFTNREGGPDGPAMLYYERDLWRDTAPSLLTYMSRS